MIVEPVVTPSTHSFYITGGTLPPEASSYVVRQADADLYNSLLAGEYCYVLNSRQMGKSSLCIRTIKRLKQQGWHTCFLDLTAIGQNLTVEQWYDGLLNRVGRQLDLEDEMEDFWEDNERFGPMQRFFAALRAVALPALSGPVVLFVDEIDVTRSLPFSTDEFFAGIRQMCVERATNQDVNRLTFCLLGTATPAELIQDTRISPFNIGKRIEIRDFTPEEAAPLAKGLVGGMPVLKRILYWTHGHPYLTQRLCQSAQEKQAATTAAVDSLCTELFLTHAAKESDDNLAFVRNRLLKSEADLAALLDFYQKICFGKKVPDDETDPLTGIIKLSGVARVDKGVLRIRNHIYAQVFDRRWIAEHMPDAELRRQKQAFRRGLALAGAVSSLVLMLIGSLAAFALNKAKLAADNEEQANKNAEKYQTETNKSKHLLYIADMNIVQQEWEDNNYAHVLQLLNETKNNPQRNFEWGYWNHLCQSEDRSLPNNAGSVFAATYSPDGHALVTGNSDHTAIVWNVQQNTRQTILRGHLEDVTSTVYFPDGKRLVTGSRDSTARVWDTTTGTTLFALQGHVGAVNCVAVSPDGKWIATGGADGTTRIWPASGGNQVALIQEAKGVNGIAFSPDGRRMVVVGDAGATVREAVSGRLLLTLHGHTEVAGVAYAPNGKWLASASQDNTIILWDAHTGLERRKLIGHTDGVVSLAFSPDSNTLVSGSWDTSAIGWNVHTGNREFTIRGHVMCVHAVAYSPDGTHILTGSWDAQVKIWPAQDSTHISLSSISATQVMATISSDGTLAALGCEDGNAYLVDIAARRMLRRLYHGAVVNAVAFSPDGQRIATGGRDNLVRIWKTSNGSLVSILKGNVDIVGAVAFSPDGNLLATGSKDGIAKIWDGTTGKELVTLHGHNGAVNAVAFSPDGKQLATGGYDYTARTWDVDTGRSRLRLLDAHNGSIMSVAWSPDGKRIATASWDHTAVVWDLPGRRASLPLRGHLRPLLFVTFSPDGKRLLTGSTDHTCKVWDIDESQKLDKEESRVVLTVKEHHDEVHAALYCADTHRLITVGKDKTISIWKISDRGDAIYAQ